VIDAQAIAFKAGLLLFVLGLLNGLWIQRTRAPRLSLSAHLTAVQSGTFLMAIAWAIPLLGISPFLANSIAWGLAASLHLLWFGFCLAGIWAAGRGLPIAGEGHDASPSRRNVVTALIAAGAFGTILGCLALLVGALA
jgi:(hydroxyamino)benzene mutase